MVTVHVFVSGDINWVQEIETCCYDSTPVPAIAVPSFGIALRRIVGPASLRPSAFTSEGPCTLKTFRFSISSFGAAGYTGGVNVRVYNDASGLPGAVLGTVFVPHASIDARWLYFCGPSPA